jgi:hypothetical protein
MVLISQYVCILQSSIKFDTEIILVCHTMVTSLLQFPIIDFVSMLLIIAILTTRCDGYRTSVVALVALPPHKYVRVFSLHLPTVGTYEFRISSVLRWHGLVVLRPKFEPGTFRLHVRYLMAGLIFTL